MGYTGEGKDRNIWTGRLAVTNIVPVADNDLTSKEYVDGKFPVTHASTTGKTETDHHDNSDDHPLPADHPHQDVKTTASPEFVTVTATSGHFDHIAEKTSGHGTEFANDINIGGGVEIVKTGSRALGVTVTAGTGDVIPMNVDTLTGCDIMQPFLVYSATQNRNSTSRVINAILTPSSNFNSLNQEVIRANLAINAAVTEGTITNAVMFLASLNTNIDYDGNVSNVYEFKSNNGIDGDSIEGDIDHGYGLFLKDIKNCILTNEAIHTGLGLVNFGDSVEVAAKIKLTTLGGYAIKLTNKTGSNSVAGQLVIAHTTQDDAVATSEDNELMTIGVFLDGGVSDGTEAWVVVSGIADVAYDNSSAIVRGDRIITGLAGLATVDNLPTAAVHFQEIGHSVESVAASGTARCTLHFN